MYVQETVDDVVKVYYSSIYTYLEMYDFLDHVDLEDWLIEKTHFVYCTRVGQWESRTLDLISQG